MKMRQKLILFFIIGVCLKSNSQEFVKKIGEINIQRSGKTIMRDLPVSATTEVIKNQPKTFPNDYYKKSDFKQQQKQKKPAESAITPSLVFPQKSGTINLKTNESQLYETPCQTLQGLNTAFAFIPPDVSSAVGFDHLFLALNDRFRITRKSGTVLREEAEQANNGFWSTIDNTNLFDPVITYDPYGQRWIFTIATDSRSGNSAFLMAVSDGPDPMAGWVFYRFDGDGDNDQWFDFPTVGFNRNWVVVNGNLFPNPGTSADTESRTWIINKDQLYAGGTVGAVVYNITGGYNTICPAKVYDPNENDLWCVTNDDVNDNDIRFFKITGTAAAPGMSEESYVSISGSWGSGGTNLGPQAGSAQRIHCGDHDVLSVIWRNGKLYSAQTVFFPDGTPDYSTIQVVISNPYDASVWEAIRFSAGANSMYAFPCLAVNASNDIVISCSRFTDGIFPSACVLVRRSNGSWVETIYKTGQDFYDNQLDTQGRLRWGDYTAAHVDPADDQSVWLASEYALPRVNGAGVWGTYWAKICNGTCAYTTYVTAPQPPGTMKKFEASNDIIAASEIQTGANIKLNAGVRIVFYPGFKASAGSQLRTYLQGCGGVE